MERETWFVVPGTKARIEFVISVCRPAPRGARDGGDAVVRGETGDQTDQESRSAGHRAAASMTAVDITIHFTFRHPC